MSLGGVTKYWLHLKWNLVRDRCGFERATNTLCTPITDPQSLQSFRKWRWLLLASAEGVGQSDWRCTCGIQQELCFTAGTEEQSAPLGIAFQRRCPMLSKPIIQFALLMHTSTGQFTIQVTLEPECIYIYNITINKMLPVVPHKAVAEVSKIGNL